LVEPAQRGIADIAEMQVPAPGPGEGIDKDLAAARRGVATPHIEAGIGAIGDAAFGARASIGERDIQIAIRIGRIADINAHGEGRDSSRHDMQCLANAHRHACRDGTAIIGRRRGEAGGAAHPHPDCCRGGEIGAV
jgi:hypothetical protein